MTQLSFRQNMTAISARLVCKSLRNEGNGSVGRPCRPRVRFGCEDPNCWANWLENAIWESSQNLPFTIRWDMGMFAGFS
jgi:hypothetical protein